MGYIRNPSAFVRNHVTPEGRAAARAAIDAQARISAATVGIDCVIFLNVPSAEVDEAIQAGALQTRTKRGFFVPRFRSLAKFRKWMSEGDIRTYLPKE
jgi:hypothetical protein